VPDKKTIEIIDIKGAFENRRPFNINEICEGFTYVVLESTDESLINDNSTIYADDKNLIAISRKQIMLFDRESGKFIRKIGTPGRGPDEYGVTVTSMPFDEQKKTIYTRKNVNERYEYDIEGNLIHRKKGPDQVNDFVNIDKNTFVSFIDNYTGNENRKLVLFNEQDSIIKIFPNYQSYHSIGNMFVYYPDAWFFSIDGEMRFCEKFNDTLFTLTPHSLIPVFTFNKGIYTFPYELRGDMLNVDNKYFLTQNIIESSRYLFYAFSYKEMIYTALYDKKQHETKVNDYEGDFGKGYLNNINNFIPLEISSVTSKNELICTMDAYKIKSWFESYPDKVKELSEPLQSLKDISETHNPVVVISKLKK
jgi:hypothetical protein